MLESRLGDEGGFTEWMGRVRKRWQAKLECLDGREEVRPTRPNKLPETMEQGIPETADFCVPLNELQRSKVCPFLGMDGMAQKKAGAC